MATGELGTDSMKSRGLKTAAAVLVFLASLAVFVFWLLRVAISALLTETPLKSLYGMHAFSWQVLSTRIGQTTLWAIFCNLFIQPQSLLLLFSAGLGAGVILHQNKKIEKELRNEQEQLNRARSLHDLSTAEIERQKSLALLEQKQLLYEWENRMHQLKSVLSALQLETELLTDSKGAVDKIDLRDLRDCEEQALNMVHDMLHLGLQPLRNTTYFDLRKAIEQAISRIEPWALQKEIDIRCSLTTSCILADSFMIVEAVTAVLENCVEFAESHTSLNITEIRNSEKTILEITHPGHLDNLDELFTRYRTTRSGHYGIGMAMALEIMESCHGTLLAENRKSSISFLFIFPSAPQEM